MASTPTLTPCSLWSYPHGFFALGPRGAMEALVVADDETVEVAR